MTSYITAIGDSQTDLGRQSGVRPSRSWAPQLGLLLRANGGNVVTRSFGVSGETSTQNLARTDVMLLNEIPQIGIIYIGVNDPGASIAQATTQANIQAMIKALKFGVTGSGFAPGVSVAGQANLPVNGQLGQRYVVLSDTSTSGGAAAWHASQTTTVTGTVTGQTVWEFRYALTGELGWGRIATAATTPTACKSIVVLSTNYLNFTTGGDTPSTPYSSYATVRVAQQAAVTAENVTIGGIASVVYADLYNLQRARILAGTDPDFSTVSYDQTKSWHCALNDQHHNAYGHQLVAQAVLAALPAAWVANLS